MNDWTNQSRHNLKAIKLKALQQKLAVIEILKVFAAVAQEIKDECEKTSDNNTKSQQKEIQKQSDYQKIKLLLTKTAQMKNCATDFRSTTDSKIGQLAIFQLTIE